MTHSALLACSPPPDSLEPPWATASASLATAWSFLLHSLSRGTVRFNLTSPFAQPILDYRAGSNPLDMALHSRKCASCVGCSARRR